MEPVVNVVGERVALGPMRREDIPHFYRWGNDLTVRRTYDIPESWTLESATKEYKYFTTAEHDMFFTIFVRPEASDTKLRPIGMTYLTAIDHRHRTAEFGIMIGPADARGKGYGTEATRLMLDYAFTALGLHSVMLRVYAFNRAGIRAYEKAGFREFGRWRESRVLAGRFYDQVYMEALATDFTSPVLGTIFAPD